MKSISQRTAVLVAPLAAAGWVGSHPSTNWGLRRSSDPNVAPNGLPGGPSAIIEYKSGWSVLDPKDHRGTHLHYCVAPYIRIPGRKETNPADLIKRQDLWALPFELALVDAKGTRLFRPVKVPTPIPANTTRELLPSPWCGEIQGATKPPEIYLEVEHRRARVIFDVPPRQAETR